MKKFFLGLISWIVLTIICCVGCVGIYYFFVLFDNGLSFVANVIHGWSYEPYEFWSAIGVVAIFALGCVIAFVHDECN